MFLFQVSSQKNFATYCWRDEIWQGITGITRFPSNKETHKTQTQFYAFLMTCTTENTLKSNDLGRLGMIKK